MTTTSSDTATKITKSLNDASIPTAALVLSAAGYVPFAGFSAGAILLPSAYESQAAFGLLIYGAIILSFLGGVHWGLEMARQSHQTDKGSPARFGISVVPSLVAWASLALPHGIAPAGLVFGFSLMLAYDLYCVKQQQAPLWYRKLRLPLTLLVCLAILLPNAF